LLLLDESNTRSIVFQVDGILKTLQQMAPGRGPSGTEQLTALADELQALTPEADLVGGSLYLGDLLQRLIQASETLSEQIGVQFFSHTGKAAGEGS